MRPDCEDQRAAHDEQRTKVANHQPRNARVRIASAVHHSKQDSPDRVHNRCVERQTKVSENGTRERVAQEDGQPLDDVFKGAQATQERQAIVLAFDVVRRDVMQRLPDAELLSTSNQRVHARNEHQLRSKRDERQHNALRQAKARREPRVDVKHVQEQARSSNAPKRLNRLKDVNGASWWRWHDRFEHFRLFLCHLFCESVFLTNKQTNKHNKHNKHNER